MRSLRDYTLFIESGSQLLRVKGDQRVPVLTATNIDKDGRFREGIFKLADTKTSQRIPNQELGANDVVMIKDGSDCGRCLLLDERIIYRFKYISEHLAVIRPIDGVDPKYLWLKLNHSSTRGYLRNIANGSSTPFITVSQLMSIPLKAIPSEAQRKLVKASQLLHEMHQIDAEVHKVFRRMELRLFEDSFGHPSSSVNAISLSKLCEFIKDGSRKRVQDSENGFPILSSRNIIPFAFQLHNVSKVSKSDFEVFAQRVLPECGDVLIALSGNNRGHATLTDSSMTLSVRNVAVVRPLKELVSPSFLVHYLNHPFVQSQLKEVHSRGSAIKYISISKLGSLQVPMPDKDAIDCCDYYLKTLSLYRQKLIDTGPKIKEIYNSLIG